MLSYQQTDSPAVNGSIAACSGATVGSGLNGKATDQAQVGGAAGSSLVTITVPAATSRAAIFTQSPAGDPGLTSWPSGNWVYRLHLTAADITGWLVLDQVYICRLNSSGVSQGTVASSTGLNLLLNATGAVSVTLSGSAQTASAGDTFYWVLVFKNGHPASPKSITVVFDQLVDTPFGAPQPIRRHQVASGSKFRGEPPRGDMLRRRVPKASTAAPPAGTFVQFAMKHRFARAQPFIPPVQLIVPMRRGRADRRRVPFASTAISSGPSRVRGHRQGRAMLRIEPPRPKAKRKRVPFIVGTPPASGTFVQKRHRYVSRAPAGPPLVVLTAARLRRKRQRPNAVVAAMVVLRHRQARGWRIATSPERGRSRRLRIKPPALPPPSGAFRRPSHRIADPPYFVPGKGRARRRRVPFAAAAPPPSGAFRRPSHRVADPPPTFVPAKGRALRRRVPRFTIVRLPVIPRHHQAQGFKRWRPEPERARKRRGRVPATAPKLRPHRLARKSISQPPTPLLRIRSLRHRLPGAQVSTPVMRKRRPTRIAPRWRPPNFDSIRHRVPRTPPVLATVIRRHRQFGRIALLPPIFKGKARRAKFYTLLTFVGAGPSPAPLRRRRRYLSERWTPEPARGRARRRRVPSVLILRQARRRMTAAVIRWPLFRVPWRRRRVAGVGPVQATVIRARKRRLAPLQPPFLRGRARRAKKYTPGTFVPAGPSPAPLLRRRRYLSQRWTPGAPRAVSKRRRLPTETRVRTARRRFSVAVVRQPPPRLNVRRRRVPGVRATLAMVIRARRSRPLPVTVLLRGRTRRTILRRPGAFIAPNPVIRRHRLATGMQIAREPRRGLTRRKRLIPPPIVSATPLLRRRRFSSARWQPGQPRGGVKRRRVPQPAQVLATVIRARKRRLAVLFMPAVLRGRVRRPVIRRPGTFVPANPVIRRHRIASGLWMTREPRRGYAKRRRLIPPSTTSPAWLLRRRRYLFTAYRRVEPQRGRVRRVRLSKITPSVRPVLGRHRKADGWKRWFPWLLTGLRRSLRRRDRLTPFIPPIAKPDLIATPPHEVRVWVEPRKTRTHVEPRHPRTWVEPKRFIGRS